MDPEDETQEYMKVLVINTVGFNINGMSSVIMNYYRYTKDSVSYDFVVNNSIDESYQKELEQNGEKIFILKNRNKKPISYILKLSKIIRAGNYDIVHIHGNSALMLIELLACDRSAVDPIKVVHGHNSDCTHRKMHQLLYRHFIKSYDHGIACSKAAGEFLYGEHEHIVLNNGIQEEQYRFDPMLRASEREKKHIPPDTKVLLHVGRFNDQKNHPFLIEIFREVRKRRPDTILRLVGTGMHFDAIRKKVTELGLDDSIRFVGETRHPEIEYNMADVFVMPSLYESFGLVTIEAQCCGLPCVLSDTIPEDIKITEHVEFLSLKRSAAEWADRICSILDSVEPSKRKGDTESVVEHGYSIQHEAQRLVDFYRFILK